MRYVLVTPTKNEELTIGKTIEAVISQTVLPLEWIIVSDGSTDQTDDIVRTAIALHPWIKLLSLPMRSQRSFASVVQATEAGIRAITVTTYDYIGLLDSDVVFQSDYFERLIENFLLSPKLGLAGGVVIDCGEPKDHLPRNKNDIPGATQFFRRQCIEDIGSFIPVPEGGWDALTCAQARMHGYETRLITHLKVDHLKPRNVSEGGIFRRFWQFGIRDFALGYHPLFEFVKCFSRLFQTPVFIGGMAWFFGYMTAVIQNRNRLIHKDLFEFIRAEQKKRLLDQILPTIFRRRLHLSA